LLGFWNLIGKLKVGRCTAPAVIGVPVGCLSSVICGYKSIVLNLISSNYLHRRGFRPLLLVSPVSPIEPCRLSGREHRLPIQSAWPLLFEQRIGPFLRFYMNFIFVFLLYQVILIFFYNLYTLSQLILSRRCRPLLTARLEELVFVAFLVHDCEISTAQHLQQKLNTVYTCRAMIPRLKSINA
jgi:hypothetical protein